VPGELGRCKHSICNREFVGSNPTPGFEREYAYIPAGRCWRGGITMAECAVCGAQVREDVPTADSDHDGETYYFESAKCKELFDEDPSQYT
jgi:YHS domain-containing protein